MEINSKKLRKTVYLSEFPYHPPHLSALKFVKHNLIELKDLSEITLGLT